MKPVMQTTLGEDKGNCMSACIASMLEMPIREVPTFLDKETWVRDLNDWLHQYGLFYLEIKWNPFPIQLSAPVLCIASGKSPRGNFLHCVIGKIKPVSLYKADMELIHDPHPNREWLIDVQDVGFLIPFDPSVTQVFYGVIQKAKDDE